MSKISWGALLTNNGTMTNVAQNMTWLKGYLAGAKVTLPMGFSLDWLQPIAQNSTNCDPINGPLI
jgi:hypothetical protein